MPAETPVTVTPDRVALALLKLQVPPGAASVNTIEEPTHTADGPVIAPSSGKGFTVIVFSAAMVPQPLVTV